MRVEPLREERVEAWERYVSKHPEASFYHRAGWRDVIARTTRHSEAYRLALEGDQVVGVLPLFLMSTGIFGKMAVSLPFLNVGGIVADNPEAEKLLAEESEGVARAFGCRYVELRQRRVTGLELPVSDRKLRSVIPLDGGPEAVFRRLYKNVRSKIRKARKSGVEISRDLAGLGDFYRLLSRNLRDLGTPVLSRRFFEAVVETFPDNVRIYRAIRYGGAQALTWAAIEDACEAGCARVDLGRGTAGSSSQNAKKYWGVEVHPLPWTYQLLKDREIPGLHTGNPKFQLAIRAWQRMPMSLSQLIGPPIARLLP
jgi:CelD/BcsL family acetyltransferase involved in cellulose biosynthesis